ncbi:MAG: DUF805 domain-containing protein, partial [Zoogloeaceae bacterium]|nr:DUF805 domain-containing protein [Zoogloeaceae bacterium]
MPPPATFSIRFDGTLTPGADSEAVKANLARIFRQEQAKIERLFTGRSVTIKRGLSEANARKYVEILCQAGAAARMEAEEPVALALQRVPITPDDEGVRKAPPPLELALLPKDPAPQASHPVAPSSPHSAQNAGHDNNIPAAASPGYKGPIAALADALQDREEYCGLCWFSLPLERIGRLRLMARSAVLMGVMLVVAFIGGGIIAHAIPAFAGGIFAGIMVAAAIFACRLSNSGLLDERPGVSLLDIALLFGVPVFLIILSMGMSFNVQQRGGPDPVNPALFYTGIFNGIIIVVTRILLMTQQIRRLRDANRSGWWCLLFLIPYLGPLFFLLLILKSGDEQFNEYGLPPPPNTLRVNLGVALFIAIAIFALVSSEATSLRLPARFFLGLTTMYRPEAPKAPEVLEAPEAPQVMPRQSARPDPDNASALPLPRPQESSDNDLNDFSKKLAAALQGCRSNVIGKGFASPPQWLRSKPRSSGRGLN